MPEQREFSHLLEGPDLSQRDAVLTQIVDTMPLLFDPIRSAEFPGQVCIRSKVVSEVLDTAFDAGVLAAVRSLAAVAEQAGVDITSMFAEVLNVNTGPNMSGLRQFVEENN